MARLKIFAVAAILIMVSHNARNLATKNDKQDKLTDDSRIASFLLLTARAQGRKTSEWNQLFGEMKRDGIKEVIIQWSQYDDKPDNYMVQLEKILMAIKKQEMRVMIGLASSSRWWTKERHEEEYLEAEYHKTKKIADKTYRLLSAHPGFVGWYIPYEIEATPLEDGERRRIQLFYKKITQHLKVLAPSRISAISGYKQSRLPREFNVVQWWTDLLQEAGIQRLYFQDGYGVYRESPVETSDELLRRLALNRSSSSAELWVVIEAFEEVGRKESDEQSFMAVPTTIQRLCRQVKNARLLGLPIAIYSYDQHMWNPESARAKALRSEWHKSDGCRHSQGGP